MTDIEDDATRPDPPSTTTLDARDPHDRSPLAPASPLILPPGTAIGRYMVLDHLGAGGMGTVHSAWDRELQRKVALKLVRPERKTGEGATQARARFLREAQALARLNHPNVVAVHDTGLVGDDVFLAMEFVEGDDLRAYLDRLPKLDDPRRWPQVVEIFQAIGQGLAAVHAAGLVHRDLKPANLMVGKDGRARVMDFGLARLVGSEGDPAEAPAAELLSPQLGSSPLAASLTGSGLRLGTPSYMAPEQFLGQACDARTDLFAFCVAFFEALYGFRPFGEGADFAGRLLRGDITPPPAGTPVPEWLHQLLLRGLARDPDQRWSSVAELMAAAAAIPRARRRRQQIFAAAAVSVGLLGFAIFGPGRRPENLCRDSEERLASVFGPARQQEIAAAFGRSGKAFAGETARALIARLAAWGHSWAEQRRDACEATHHRGEQSADLLDRRMLCLDRRLDELAASASLLAQADLELAENPAPALALLGDLEACADLVQLTATAEPPPAAQRDPLAALQRQLVEVKTRAAAGELAAAESLAQTAATAAEKLGYLPLLAEAHLTSGELAAKASRFEAAEASWLAAIAAAIAANDLDAQARAADELASLYSEQLGQPQPALSWLHIAEAAASRLGRRPLLTSSLAHTRAMVAAKSGDNTTAFAELEKALALARQAPGTEDRQSVLANDLGIVLGNMGRYPEAEAATLEGLALDRRLYGEKHPLLAETLNNLGSLQFAQGHQEEAARLHLEAVELLRASYGSEHRLVALSMNNAATALRALGRGDEADRYQLEALAIQERVLGKDHIEVANSLTNLAFKYRESAELDKALVFYLRALPIFDKNLGPTSYFRAGCHHGTGVTLSRLGRPAEALPHLQFAFDVFHQNPTDARVRGNSAFQMAKTLWDDGRDRGRARLMANQALADYRGEAARFPREIAAVETWLSEHR